MVPGGEFDTAITYRGRGLEGNAAPATCMAGADSHGRDIACLDKEGGRLIVTGALVGSPTPAAWAVQERSEPTSVFTNASDTDPALLSNQRWADSIRESLPAPDLGSGTVTKGTLKTAKALDEVLETAVAAGKRWAATPTKERAAALHRLGVELEAMRTELVTVAADEVGKLIDQADIEVSEACDFAHYYASLAGEEVDGATHLSLIPI